MAIELATRSVTAAAPRALCFEVVAAAGRVVEEVSRDERLVEFKTTYRGRDVVTVERLQLHRPERIDYEWVKGPLPFVRESITFSEDGPRHTTITYRGSFDVHGALLRRLVARLWIKRAFERIVGEHLDDAKQMSEKRARRSRVYADPSRDSGGRT